MCHLTARPVDDVSEVSAISAERPPPLGYDPFSYQVQQDPYPGYAWLREKAPVYRNEERHFFALSRHADVLAAFRDPARFTNRNGISLESSLWGPQAYKNVLFLALDPPDHTAMRGLVQRKFAPRAVAAGRRIRELTRRRLDPLLEHDSFDFALHQRGFASLPCQVVRRRRSRPAAQPGSTRT